MAKKKSGLNNRIVGGIIGAVVVLVVVVPVLQLVLGVDILPESFEIPFTEQEQIQTNQQLIDQANDLLCGGGGGTGDPDQIQILSDGTILDPNQDACIPQGETASEGEEVSPEEIEEKQEELEKMIIDPPIVNQTTSEDPPLEQLCDQEPENILCQVTQVVSALRLESVVTKIDSTGLSTSDLGVFEIPSLAFLVEDPTDRDFRTGFLELTLRILSSDQGTQFDATGTFDVLINNQTVLSEPIPIQVSGIIDDSGGLPLSFLSETGLPSPLFTFDFNANFDNFINEEVNLLEFRVNLLDVIEDQVDLFSLIDQTLFEMDVSRDDIQLIIVDEQMQTLRIYPTDSRIVITSKANTIKGTQCLIYQRLVDQLGTGCSIRNLSCPCFGTSIGIGTNNVVAGTTSPPSITGINLFDQNGQFLLSELGGSSGVVFDQLVTRNENYTLQILSPIISTDLSFGKPQQTQSFTCIAEGTPRHKISVVTTGVTDRCGAGLCNYYYYIVTDGVTTRATTCNFPQETP